MTSSASGRVALLLGATGETGKEVLKCLLGSEAVAKVVLVGRREIEVKDNEKDKVRGRRVCVCVTR